MSNLIKFVDSASKFLTNTQLESVVRIHNAIYDSGNSEMANELNCVLEGLSDKEITTLIESLNDDDADALMEAGLLRLIPSIGAKLFPKFFAKNALKSAAKTGIKKNAAIAAGNTTKASKLAAKEAQQLNKANKISTGMKPEKFANMDRELSSGKYAEQWANYKSGATIGGRKLNAVTQAELNSMNSEIKAVETEINSVKAAQASKLSELQAAHDTKVASIQQQINEANTARQTALNNAQKGAQTKKIKTLEAEIEKENMAHAANIEKVNSEFNIQTKNLETQRQTLVNQRTAKFNTIDNNGETIVPNMNDIQSNNPFNRPYGSQTYGVPPYGATRYGVSPYGAPQYGVPPYGAQPGMQGMPYAFAPLATNTAKEVAKSGLRTAASKGFTKVIKWTGRLGLLATGIVFIKDIFHIPPPSEFVLKGLAMLASGYVGVKAAEAFFPDSSTAKIVGGVSGAGLAMILMNLADGNDENEKIKNAKMDVNTISRMNPNEQQALLQELGIAGNLSLTDELAKQNGFTTNEFTTAMKGFSFMK